MNNGIRYYRQPVIDLIARNVLDGYDRRLLIGKPTAIQIDDIIESLGLIVEYHYLRNCDRICGETVFDTAEVIVYDMEKRKYKTIIVKGGTIIADAHLLDSGNEGRLRFSVSLVNPTNVFVIGVPYKPKVFIYRTQIYVTFDYIDISDKH